MATNRRTGYLTNEDTPSNPAKSSTTTPVKTPSIAGTKRAREVEVDIADRVRPPYVFRVTRFLKLGQPPTDFFGRPLVQKPKSTISQQIMQGPTAGRLTKTSYKFHQGNSAAVRKPVKISLLLK